MITTRAEFESAQKSTDKAMRSMFEQMANEINGIIAQSADANGVVPPAKAQAVRDSVKRAVQRYFVQERTSTGSDRQKELERLHSLIDDAQKAMRGASEREKVQLRGRVSLLSKRIALLQQGTALTAFDSDGRGVSPYARALREGIISVVMDVVNKNAEIVKRVVDAASKINR